MRSTIFLFFASIFVAGGIAAVALSFAATLPAQAQAQTAQTTTTPSSNYLRIFYFREGPNARSSFFAHADEIDVFAPQVYSLTATGTLQGSLSPDLLAFAAKNNIKVMPLVVNQAFSQSIGEGLLNNPAAETTAINALVAEAKKQGYWGWQIDFEQIDASYQSKFSAFVTQFGAAMKANGLESSVAVVAQTSNNPQDYTKNLWQRLIGVYDYAAIGSAVDIVSVMSYDDAQSAGPVTRYDWLIQVINYSLKNIPAQKLSIGIGLYYWDWNTSTGKLIGIGGASGIDTIVDTPKYRAKQYFSAVSEAPFIQYIAHGIEYLLWFENSQSVAQKVALIKEYHLNGFSAWALGLEVPSVWAAVKE